MAFAWGGQDGSIKRAGVAVGHIDTWEMTATAGEAEHTALGDKDGKYIYTKRDHTGRAGGTLDLDDTGQAAIVDMFMKPGTLSLVVLDLVNSGAYKFYGSALISNVSVGVPLEDKQTISFDFKFSDGVYRASS